MSQGKLVRVKSKLKPTKILQGPKFRSSVNVSLGQFFFNQAEKYKDNICQISALEDKSETYGSVKLRTIRLALELEKKGIRSKDVIAVCSDNSMDNIIPVISALYVGAKVVNLDHTMNNRQMKYLMNLVAPAIIFVEEAVYSLVKETIKESNLKTEIIILGQQLKPYRDENMFSPSKVDVHETAILFFSSGISGAPRAACHSHYSINQLVQTVVNSGLVTPNILHSTSFCWITIMIILMCAFMHGSTRLFIRDIHDGEKIFKFIDQYKITSMFMAPFQIDCLLNPDLKGEHDVDSLQQIILAGTPVRKSFLKLLGEIFNKAKIIFNYGLTEVGMITTFNPSIDQALIQDKLGSCGKVAPETKIKFLVLLERSKLANVTLQYKQATIFAPINAAFQKYQKNKEDDDPNNLVLYHMTTIPKRTDQLGTSYTSLNSELEGNPPLWITHITGTYHDDIFVNNARLLLSQSNIQTIDKNRLERVLHKIDEVLIPTRSSKTAENKVYNPTALEFLEYYESLIIHPHRLRSFRQKVQQFNKQEIFKTEGGHTFFIPVDEGFKNKRADMIDEKIIDGHVIPKQVLFTNPTKKDVPFQTLANGDNNVRVVISFTQETRGTEKINYVKSHTLLSAGKIRQGVVLSEIVQANIPVKNGVVHLIQKPLMVVDNNVKELLQEKDGGILNSFVTAINKTEYKEFLNTIEKSEDITLFAPCNAAWNDDYTLSNAIADKEKFKEILKMHLVTDHRLYVDTIVQNSITKVQTLDPRKDLYFNVVTTGTNRTVTVEGGGVNATVIQSDLAATNGIIHIIDRVLGIPYSTVYDKLRIDSTLNATYQLGNRGGFNSQLNDTTKKFTYFVPHNEAWTEAGIAHPSAIKKLFMPEFHYHATNILERHLVISDEPYTMERIKLMTERANEGALIGKPVEVALPSVRGELRLFVEETPDHAFVIRWKGERIPVYRPNVACTNGVIHIIGAPFLQDGDIRVSGASSLHFAPHLIMMLAAKWLLL